MLSNLRPFARQAMLMAECFKTDTVKCMSYRAAILDSFGKKLKIKKLENNVKLKENEVNNTN
jgi:hypothetical protein